MLRHRSFFILILLTFFTDTFADFIKIDKIDGRVLQDKSGSFQARILETGSKVNEGVIINSRKDSYARLRFHDNSTIVVGPDTNIKIESHEKKSATIIYLTKGIIRPKIEKDQSTGEMEKFYVLTPTGLVGVKGTEFLVHYNQENKKTTVITFKGAVRFARINLSKLRKQKLYSSKLEKEHERDENNNIRLKNIERKEAPDDKKIELALDKFEAVTVAAGQYSETVGLIKRTSMPTLISPIQLNILFRNANLKYIYDEEKLNKATIVLKKNKTDIPFEIPNTPASGLIDLSNKKYAPKAGGFWDISSGLYIPPAKESVFFKPAGIFVADKIGDLDSITGQYIAPIGLTLDPNKGVLKKKLKKGAQEELKQSIDQNFEKLKVSLHENIVVGKENDSIYTLGILSKRELISKNVVSLSVDFVDHTLSMSNDTAAADRDYKSKDSMEYTLRWDHESSLKWQPTMEVSWQNLSYPLSELSGAPQDGERLFKMKLGYRYSASPDWNIALIGGLEQLYFLDHNATTDAGSGNDAMKRVTLPRFHLVFDAELFSKGRWSLDGMLSAMYSLGRSPGNFDIGSGIGAKAKLSTKYWWSRKWWLGLGASRYVEKYSVSNINFSATAVQKGSSYGLNLGFIL